MGWLDDLSARVKQEANEVVGDVKTYLTQRTAAQVVKVAAPKTGNLTAAEIASGARGGTAPVAATSAIQAAPLDQKEMLKIILPVVGVLAVAAFFIAKRRG